MKETITIPKQRISEAIWALMLSLVIMFFVAHFGTISYEKDYTPATKQFMNNAMNEYYQKERQKLLRTHPNETMTDFEKGLFKQSVNAELAIAAGAPIFSVGPYEHGIVKGTWDLHGFRTISIDYEHEKAEPRWGIDEDEVNYLRRSKYYLLSVVYDWQYTLLSTITIILLLWGHRNFKRNYKIVIR